MIKNGFIKVAGITPKVFVGNPKKNVEEMLNALKDVKASIAVFPELSVTGYTCQDLFYQSELLEDVLKGISYFLENNQFEGLVLIGAPISVAGSLFNCALVIQKDKILGIVPKRSLPSSKEFYEKRWFKSGEYEKRKEIIFLGQKVPFGSLLFSDNLNHLHIAVEICEDMWSPISPSNLLAYHGANITLNLSASNETLGKSNIRRNTVLENSRKNCGAYIYVSSGAMESTSDTVYSSHNIIAQNGKLIKESEEIRNDTFILYGDIDLGEINFLRHMNTNLHDDIHIDFSYQEIFFHLEESKDYLFEDKFDKTPFVPKVNQLESFKKIKSILEYALYKRILHTNSKKLIIGISGGLDSTLALLISVNTFKMLKRDLHDILAITMPGFATSDRTKSNAKLLMERLGVSQYEIPINDEAALHLKKIGHDESLKDVVYENVQARIRTLILMNMANKENGIVLGTGDMSELALGWCTYNGDQMSMYGINSGLPKTLVKFMILEYAKNDFSAEASILNDILDTPISPELSSESQKTEDFIGKYEVNDFILNRYLSCGDSKERIIYLLKLSFDMSFLDAKKAVDNFFHRFFMQQFKRQALPDGPKVLDISLNPRSDYKMPSDISRG